VSDPRIRPVTDGDWAEIWPFFAAIVADGETYAYPDDLTSEQARELWMERPPGLTVVLEEEGRVLGTAKMGPNRPSRGDHIGTASFMVDPPRAAGASAARSRRTSSTGTGSTGTPASSSTPWWRPTRPRCTCGSQSGSRSSAPCLVPSARPVKAGSAST
jgi:hypothetical protein